MGFEPTGRRRPPVFETGAIVHSTILPRRCGVLATTPDQGVRSGAAKDVTSELAGRHLESGKCSAGIAVPDVAVLADSSNPMEASMAPSRPPVPSNQARAASAQRSLASHTLGSTLLRVFSSREAAWSTRRQASLHRESSHRFIPQPQFPRTLPCNAGMGIPGKARLTRLSSSSLVLMTTLPISHNTSLLSFSRALLSLRARR